MGSPWAGTCVSDPSRAWCVFMRLSLCAFVRIVARVLEMGRSPSPGRLSWWGSCVEAVRAVISPVRRPRPPYAVASVALNLRPLRLIQQSLGAWVTATVAGATGEASAALTILYYWLLGLTHNKGSGGAQTYRSLYSSAVYTPRPLPWTPW